MIELQLRFVNPKKVRRDLDKLRVNIKKTVGPAIDEILKFVKVDAVRTVRVRTGKTRRSIDTMRSGLRGHIGSDWFVSRFIEGGTKYMSPRPFLEPAVTKNERRIGEAIIKALNKAIDKTRRESGHARNHS